MKKLMIAFVMVMFFTGLFSQVPQGITHQAVIRNAQGQLVTNAAIGIRLSILQGSAEGAVVFVETHMPTSNQNGLITYIIGQGTPVSGSFEEIDWAAGPYFLKTEADPGGGMDYSITGTTQFLSVPYALHAKTAESVAGSISSNILPPKAIAQTPTNLEPGIAVLNGMVNAEGFSTSVVFEWGETMEYGNTIIADQSPVTGSSDIAVSALITDLHGLTEYHFRIKADNAVDATISNNNSFVSDVYIPRVNTLPITDITPNSAVSGGDIFHDGGSPVIERGIVWSTLPDPCIENNQGMASEGSGTGVYYGNITGLILGTIYYVKAFATNNLGTAYGEELLFTTEVPDVVFVSPYGDDSNPGSFGLPKLTIQAGISSAANSIKDVYVAAGTYTSGTIFLANGVSIFGGFHPDTWEHNENHQVIISHDGSITDDRIVGVQGIDITSNTVLDLLTIQTPSAGSHGISNYGIHLISSGGLNLQKNNIIAGDGSTGAEGLNGSDGLDGNNGLDGITGDCDNDVTATGGSGGSSPIGRSGGAGGAGRFGNNPGFNGAPGQAVGSGGGSGGQGGGANGCDGGDNGSSGQPGNSGFSGSNGNGGSGGSVVSDYWLSLSGEPGASGSNGHGGGGGGGGGGQGGMFCADGTGNGGGGGGAGGGGGSYGYGGSGGGGSFGLFIINSTGLQLSENTISSGNGGAGGSGGSGGCPGAGGPGGQGADECLAEVGRGGNGGNGGNGGQGGHGGGGAGGPSYAVFLSDTSVDLGGNILTHGNAGEGGSPASKDCSIGGLTTGNAGAAGAFGNQN